MEQNFLDRNPDSDWNFLCGSQSKETPVYTRHSLFNIPRSVTIVFIVQPLLDGPVIAIHTIPGFKISRS